MPVQPCCQWKFDCSGLAYVPRVHDSTGHDCTGSCGGLRWAMSARSYVATACLPLGRLQQLQKRAGMKLKHGTPCMCMHTQQQALQQASDRYLHKQAPQLQCTSLWTYTTVYIRGQESAAGAEV